MTRVLEVTGDLVEIDMSLHAVYRRMELVFFAKTSAGTCQGQPVKNFATITRFEPRVRRCGTANAASSPTRRRSCWTPACRRPRSLTTPTR